MNKVEAREIPLDWFPGDCLTLDGEPYMIVYDCLQSDDALFGLVSLKSGRVVDDSRCGSCEELIDRFGEESAVSWVPEVIIKKDLT